MAFVLRILDNFDGAATSNSVASFATHVPDVMVGTTATWDAYLGNYNDREVLITGSGELKVTRTIA